MSEIAIARAGRLIKKGEGCELKVYTCPAGKPTIGYGRNLEDRGISMEEAEHLLKNDLENCARDLSTFAYFQDLSANRKAALLDMRFNLGHGGFRKFRKMHAAFYAGDVSEAARQMLDSTWAHQVKGRAISLARIIETGELNA